MTFHGLDMLSVFRLVDCLTADGSNHSGCSLACQNHAICNISRACRSHFSLKDRSPVIQEGSIGLSTWGMQGLDML